MSGKLAQSVSIEIVQVAAPTDEVRALVAELDGEIAKAVQKRKGGIDEPRPHFLPRRLEQDALVRHPGSMMDPVVDREAVAEVLEHRPARRARDQAKARDDQPLEEHLHEEDLLLEQVGLEEHVRELVEVRVALPSPPTWPISRSQASV